MFWQHRNLNVHKLVEVVEAVTTNPEVAAKANHQMRLSRPNPFLPPLRILTPHHLPVEIEGSTSSPRLSHSHSDHQRPMHWPNLLPPIVCLWSIHRPVDQLISIWVDLCALSFFPSSRPFLTPLYRLFCFLKDDNSYDLALHRYTCFAKENIKCKLMHLLTSSYWHAFKLLMFGALLMRTALLEVTVSETPSLSIADTDCVRVSPRFWGSTNPV